MRAAAALCWLPILMAIILAFLCCALLRVAADAAADTLRCFRDMLLMRHAADKAAKRAARQPMMPITAAAAT